MSVQIIKIDQQGDGAFNGGAILEKKPIPFSGDTKGLRPYSNLFYWAHAWSEKGSTIGEHPHQAFEIMSFVLKGDIRHYDSKNRKWIPLHAGDVQIIRAGNGISHAEHIEAGAEIFQIWFDPEINQALQKPATYNDYPARDFPVISGNGGSVRVLVGGGSPVKMDSEGIFIKEQTFGSGSFGIPMDMKIVYSIFILEGELSINGIMAGAESINSALKARDFFKIQEENSLGITTAGCRLFIIESPLRPGYKTYSEYRN